MMPRTRSSSSTTTLKSLASPWISWRGSWSSTGATSARCLATTSSTAARRSGSSTCSTCSSSVGDVQEVPARVPPLGRVRHPHQRQVDRGHRAPEVSQQSGRLRVDVGEHPAADPVEQPHLTTSAVHLDPRVADRRHRTRRRVRPAGDRDRTSRAASWRSRPRGRPRGVRLEDVVTDAGVQVAFAGEQSHRTGDSEDAFGRRRHPRGPRLGIHVRSIEKASRAARACRCGRRTPQRPSSPDKVGPWRTRRSACSSCWA